MDHRQSGCVRHSLFLFGFAEGPAEDIISVLSPGKAMHKVRVRFAPSPTGHLHIGGGRTALFNWLYARHCRGVFILRIEDTDTERSSEDMAEGILEGMRWLGLGWDEGPFYQSKRLDLYRSTCARLLKEGHAYRCFCPPKTLEEKKRQAQKAGHAWKYDGTCRALSDDQVQDLLAQSQPFALRFKVPPRETVHFKDTVYGEITVETDNVEDFVILRSDQAPTYHLSVVADDIDMEITHVIRGVDHLSNTSKHVLLYRALGEPIPVYAHLPLILGTDKKRLSKRHGATSVVEYRDQGILPSALRNYLALLGWSPGGDQEFFSDEELIAAFDLSRINKANAVFDPQKLEWMNGKAITESPAEAIEDGVRQVLEKASLWTPELAGAGRSRFLSVIDLLKSRIRKLTDFADFGRAFFTDNFDYEADAVQKYLTFGEADERERLERALLELAARYSDLEPFDLVSTEAVLREIGGNHGLKPGRFIGAVRVGLTGRAVAPGLFDVILALGREKSVDRIRTVAGKLR